MARASCEALHAELLELLSREDGPAKRISLPEMVGLLEAIKYDLLAQQWHEYHCAEEEDE